MSDESRLIGFTALRARACFHARGVEISFQPFTWAIRSGSFPRARAPLQSSFAHSSPPSPFRAWADCQGLFPLHDMTGDASTHFEGSQVLDTFRPQVLSTSRRLSPRSGSWACFVPEPLPGSLLVQGLPISAQRSCLFGTICPLAVAITCRSPGTSPDAHGWHPRLRGFAPRWSSRTTRSVINLPRGRTPLRVHSPPGPDFLPRFRLIRNLRS